jgi:HK97 family phage prohead protease
MTSTTPKAGSGLPEQRKYERCAEYIGAAAWAIHPQALSTILQIIGERREGHRPSAAEIRDRLGVTQDITDAPEASDSPVAVIPLYGAIVPRADFFSDVSGAASVETFQTAFRDALASPDVSAILIDIDSPGGSAAMIPEVSAEILKARGTKPIVAVANTFAASAAYWIASVADELVVSPSAQVGSIGVYSAHDDISAAQEKLGVKTTLISAGKYKTEANPFEPLSDDARAEIKSKVDAIHEMFIAAVAKGRGVSVATVRDTFGQGRMVMADKAVELGMADRVATFGQTLARLEKTGAARKARTAGGTTERRTVPIEGVEWRDSAASGEAKMIVRGHAVVFDRLSLNLGGFKERFAAGSLDEVLDGNPDVHLDWDHLTSLALARTRSNQYQLELRRDPQGLHFYATVAPTSYAKDLRVLMESGVIDQASVVFTTPEDGSGEKWEIDGNGDVIRTITKVDGLYGICISAQGAYPQTDSYVVRNLRSRLSAEVEGGRLPEAALRALPNDVAPVDPAGRRPSQDSHTRTELELAKRRLLDAEREQETN